MEEYKIMDNYLIFKELGSDSIGTNFRVGEIKNNKPINHKLMTKVHPFLSQNPNIWKRISILLEGIKKSNISNLYSPDKILKGEKKSLLVYPLLKGKTFEQILEDSTQKDIPINFDLALSIGVAVADLIDVGSSIVVSGQKSFHGFLTPDNIIIDYNGTISLKNYGLHAYLSKSEDIFSEMTKKYGSWLSPEFMKKEKLLPQSDIYHLGYIIYRMLTGHYFSYSPDENFESKLSNISFSQNIPSTDKVFFSNIINFFQKTLNPDPSKRFSSIREFKDYITNYFHLEEFSSITFNLAYFMNSIYLETQEEEENLYKQELAYKIPVKKAKDQSKSDSELVENILTGLDERKGSKSKVLFAFVLVAFIGIAITGFLYIKNQSKKAETGQIKALEMENMLAQLREEQKKRDQNYQENLKAIESKITLTEEEKTKQQEEIQRIKKDWQLQKQKEQERFNKMEEEKKIQESELARKKMQEELAKKKQTDIKKAQEEKKKVEQKKIIIEKKQIKEGQILSATEVDVQPIPVSTPSPNLVRTRKFKAILNTNQKLLISFLIDHHGNVEKVKLIKKSSMKELDTLIVEAVKKWKYKPATKDSIKVKTWKTKWITIKMN